MLCLCDSMKHQTNQCFICMGAFFAKVRSESDRHLEFASCHLATVAPQQVHEGFVTARRSV